MSKPAAAPVNNAEPSPLRPGYAMVAGIASITVVTILIVIKTAAYWHSGSVSVLASLVDSLMDAAVSFINFMAIRYSLKPADHDHRYGHGKIEGLAALFQAAFIAGAGVFLLFEALRRVTRPEVVAPDMLVIGVMVTSVVLSLVLVLIQKFTLKYAPSLAVEADQAHYSGDIAINLGVIAVLGALYYGGPVWLDPLFAVAVVLYLGFIARQIALKGVDMLLDRELQDDSREKILDIIYRHPAVRGVHDLRTRKSGMEIYVAFDLELDPDKSLREAHAVANEIELQILAVLPNAQIMIHKDPAGVPHTDSRHPRSGVHD